MNIAKRTILACFSIALISGCSSGEVEVKMSNDCSNQKMCIEGFNDGLEYVKDVAKNGGSVSNPSDACMSQLKVKAGNPDGYSIEAVYYVQGCQEAIEGYAKATSN